MTAATTARRLGWVADGLALACVLTLDDLHPGVPALVAALFLASRIGILRLGRIGLLVAGTSLILSAPALAHRLHLPWVLVAAHLAPAIHSLLWLSRRGLGNHGELVLRLGVGFIELIVASAMVADVHVPLAIFLFGVVGSVALSCAHLDRRAREYAPDGEAVGPVRLPRGFLARSLATAGAILLASAAIFPLIPRPQVALGLGLGGLGADKTAGYTESVALDRGGGPGGVGDGAVAFRIFPRRATGTAAMASAFYLGLFRVRALSEFDGEHWRPGRAPFSASAPAPVAAAPKAVRTTEFEVLVEPFGSRFLPVPYGAKSARIELMGIPRPFGVDARTGDWAPAWGAQGRSRYWVDVAEIGPGYENFPTPLRGPTPGDLEVPERLRTPRLRALFERAFGPADRRGDAVERMSRVSEFFRREGFHAVDAADEDGAGSFDDSDARAGEASVTRNLSPLELFLIHRRRGHCELFASAAAVMLRWQGVPARLVSGFRLGRSGSGVLTVRQGDAHAWVEYWAADRVGSGGRWRVYDPTPRLNRKPGLLDEARSWYEALSALWYQRVYTYDAEAQGQWAGSAIRAARGTIDPGADATRGWSGWLRARVERWSSWMTGYALLLVAGALLAGGAAWWATRTFFPWVLSIRYRIPKGRGPRHRRLQRELAAFDRRRRRLRDAAARERAAPWIAEWEREYSRLRFGPEPTLPADFDRGLESLRERRLSLDRAA